MREPFYVEGVARDVAMKVGTFQFALLVLVFSSIGAGQLAGQSVPRTADGRPDLQGVWDFRTMTPLQRPQNRTDRHLDRAVHPTRRGHPSLRIHRG